MEERKLYRLIINNDEEYNDEAICNMWLTKAELNIFKWLNQVDLLSTFDYSLLEEETKLNPEEMKFDW
jgi:hypothetical protein